MEKNAKDQFHLTIHMVSSLDGFIAKKDNSISWFDTTDHYEKGSTGEDAETFLAGIDCYIMGSRTYEHALELSRTYGWPYGETPAIVLTKRNLPVERSTVELYSGNPQKLVTEILKPRYRNVWLAGGAALAADFLRLGLAQELRLSIIPILLGDGLPFWGRTEQEQLLHLKNIQAYKNGIVELCYEIKNS